MREINVIDCFNEGYEYFKKNMGLSIGGWFIFLLISLVGGLIPILNIIYNFFVSPAMTGGFMKFYLNLARDDNPKIEDLFFGFKRYGSLLGLFWLYFLAILILMLPTIILAIIAGNADDPGFGVVFFGILNFLGILFVLLRFAMVYWILIDEPRMRLFDALKESSRLLEGHYWQLIGLYLLGLLIAIVSLLLFIIPIIFTYQIIMISMGRFYIKLKENAGEIVLPEISVEPPIE